MIIVGLFLFIVGCLAINYLLKFKRMLDLASKIPQSNFKLSFNDIITFDSEKIFGKLFNFEDDGLSKIWFGPLLAVNVTSLEDVKIIMNSKCCIDKPYLVKLMKLPNSLTFGNIDAWHRHRKIMNPYFTTQSISTFIPNFIMKSKKLVESVNKMEGKEDFNIFPFMAAMALESFLANVESDTDILDNESKFMDLIKIVNNIEKLLETVMFRIWRLYLHPEIIYKQTSMYKRECELRSQSGDIIASKVLKNIRHNEDGGSKGNFIRELTSLKHNLSADEIYDETISLYFGVQITTPTTISWVLLYLGIHKDIQAKVIDELRQVLGNDFNDIDNLDYDKINQLKYLEMVINEVLRVQSPFPFVLRKLSDEITTSEGYILPKETIALIRIVNIHRDEKHWGNNADQFKPERFEDLTKIHPYSFIPFSKGHRMCIGWRYAMILMKIQLGHFLACYEVNTNVKLDELKYRYELTMNLVDGHMISIEKRRN